MMPVKMGEIASIGLYFQNDNGEYEKFCDVDPSLVDLTSEEIPGDESVNFILPNECEITFTIDRISRKNLMKLAIGTNNWRRMHGLPMRSYKRRRHEKHR